MKGLKLFIVVLFMNCLVVHESKASDQISTVINSITQRYVCVISATETVLVEDNPKSGTQIIEINAGVKKVKRAIKKLNRKKRKAKKKKKKKIRQNVGEQKDNLAGIRACGDQTLAPALAFDFDSGLGTMRDGGVNVQSVLSQVRINQYGEGLRIEGSFLTDNPDEAGQIDMRAELTSTSTDGLVHNYEILRGQINITGETNILDDRVSGTIQADYTNVPTVSFTFSGTSRDSFDNSGGAFSFTGVKLFPVYILPTSVGDADGDGDNDFADLRAFGSCYTGPVGGAAPECSGWDANSDGSVDYTDHIAIFADGFESGNTSAWSSVVP